MGYKVRYSVRARVWNQRTKDYDYEVLLDRVESETDAMCFYNKTKVSANLPQIELWEELVNRYGVEEESRRMSMKDELGEYYNE